MILTAYQLLRRHPAPSEKQIRHALDGNLCRCTGYQHIIDAAQQAAKKMRRKAADTRQKKSRV
jgi:carbon-monoxide dehydrogenase small subunit